MPLRHPGVAQLVGRLIWVQDAGSSNLPTRTMQSVLIGSEYPVMDTLLFYVENGEKPELSMLTRSRRHSRLTSYKTTCSKKSSQI